MPRRGGDYPKEKIIIKQNKIKQNNKIKKKNKQIYIYNKNIIKNTKT